MHIRAWCVCKPVSLCVQACVCVYRHQDGGVGVCRTAILGRFRMEVAFAANGLSSTHTKHTLEPAMQLPVSSGRRFCHGFVSVSIEAQQRLRSVGLHLSTPSFHHTPWDLLSWQLDRTALTATSGCGVQCCLPGAP